MGAKKIFCYVDETGQDNLGKMFIVSVIMPEERDGFFEYLCELEIKTGRGKVKWGRADAEKRLKYLQEIFSQRKYPFTKILWFTTTSSWHTLQKNKRS